MTLSSDDILLQRNSRTALSRLEFLFHFVLQCNLMMQARIQGRWNWWIFTPPPFFWAPFFFFLSLKWNNIWLLWHYYKNSPPFQNPGSALAMDLKSWYPGFSILTFRMLLLPGAALARQIYIKYKLSRIVLLG